MIRIGTLGAARITPRALIYPAVDEPNVRIDAIAARDASRSEGFAQYHNISRVLDSYADVVTDSKLDAIYNPLPISAHRDLTIQALSAGKHVLCEKSFACNEAEARDMQAAAESNDRIVMDAFHYRYHPLFHSAREVIANGELGDIESIAADFHTPVPMDPTDIRMIYETGGGVTMDIGCYPISWVRHLMAAEPTVLSASAEVGPPHVDVFLTAEFEFPGGTRAVITGDMRGGKPFTANVVVKGTRGEMQINNPLVPQMGHSLETTIGSRRDVRQFDRRATYGYQLDAFLQAIQTGKPPLTDGKDAVSQMRVIDRCYEAAGLPLRGMDVGAAS